MSAESSRDLYATFLEDLGQAYKAEKIQDGKFGAMMNVSLTNECGWITYPGRVQGPVTFTLDSRKFEYVDQTRTSGTNTPKSR
ncbi:hypothetical protein H0H93_016703 [Arthromyces matolae]|nr:hypothetical protein H0H93_016703 [Arthromyces matolae]